MIPPPPTPGGLAVGAMKKTGRYIIPSRLGEAYIAITTKDETEKGYNAAKQKAASFVRDITTGIAQGVGQALARGIGTLVRGAVDEIGKSVQAASDLSESINKLEVAFGSAGQGILEWSKDSATALGQSQQQALEAASSFGLLFRQIGVGQDEAAGMSEKMVQLAADLASINNIPVADALTKLQSGLIGEVRPLREVGVLLNDNVVSQKAVALGLATSTQNVDDQSKVLARYNLILQQTTLQQGDFARTSTEVANQQRIFTANLDNLRATFGQAFTPIYGAILQGLNALIGQIAPYGEGIVQSLATGMTQGLIYVIQVMGQIRQIFTYWLQAHSPPRLLPDLAKWGTAAINAYLEGWSNADFGILSGIGSSIESILRSFVGSGKLGETDLVSTILGSESAIVAAINEWHRLGSVSAGSLDAIRRAAGPAGDAIADLVQSYFELQGATRKAADAQRELDDVTRAYDARLKPLNDKLDANQARQQKIRDDQRLFELGQTINDPTQSVSERRLARLEQEEILLRQQQTAVEKERDTAVDSAQKKLDAATAEQKAKEEIYNQQQASLDQQVKVNNLLGEEAALRQRLADEALAKQKQALAELEAEQRKAAAADKERMAELERIYQAQLQYNLQIADTPGKIALLRLELGRYKDGSAEYYGILTQIAGLEQQLAKERDKAGGAGGLLPDILPPVGSLDVPSWANDLAGEIKKAMDEAFGTGTDKDALSLSDRLRGASDGAPEMSKDLKDFADALRTFGQAIIAVTPPLKELLLLFDPAAPKKNQDEISTNTNSWLTGMTAELKFWASLFKGDWNGAWDNFKLYAATTQTNSGANLVLWLGEMLGNITTFLTTFQTNWVAGWTTAGTTVTTWLGDTLKTISEFSLGPAAESLLYSFFTGLSTYWNETIAPWWVEKTKWIADLLPGSEPKNPQSPLRGLAGRGEALMGNLQRGMEAGAAGMQTQFNASLGGLAGSTTNTTANHLGPIQIVFQGPVTDAGARSAARVLDDELRRRGFK
jgi:hypothetical protein